MQSNCILSTATQHQVYCLTQGETDTRRHRLINSRSETTNISSRLNLALLSNRVGKDNENKILMDILKCFFLLLNQSGNFEDIWRFK